MNMSFWVRIDLDPAYALEASDGNVARVCEEIKYNVAGVHEVLPVEKSIGEVFDGYIGDYKC